MPLVWMLVTRVCYVRLGSELYGVWVLAVGLLSLGDVVGVGLTDATIRFVAKYRARDDLETVKQVIRSTLLFYSVIGALAAVAIWFAAPIIALKLFRVPVIHLKDVILAIRICSFGLWVKLLHSVFLSAIQGFERHAVAARLGMVVTITTGILQIWLVLCGFGLVSVLCAHVGMLLVGAILLVLALRTHLLPGFWPYPRLYRSTLKAVLQFGVLSWFQTVMSYAANNADHFLITYYAGPQAVAYYAIALRLIRFIHQFLSRAAGFLFPLSGKLFEQGADQKVRILYNASSTVVSIAASVLLVPLYLLGHEILLVWIGDPELVSRAAPVLWILCIRYALLPVSIVNYNFLLGAGRIGLQAAIVAISTPAALIGMWLLIPHWGPLGAAMGHLLYVPFAIWLRLYVGRSLFKGTSVFESLYPLVPILGPLAVAALGSLAFSIPAPGWSGVLIAFVLLASITLLASALLSYPMLKTVLRACQLTGEGEVKGL